MILALAVILGLIASLVRHRGQISSQIAAIPLQWAWLAVVALLLQVPLLRTPLGSLQQVQVQKYLFLISHVLLLAFVWRNRRIAGIQIVAIGVVWNLAAVLMNDGLMPITPGVLTRINPGTTPEQWPVSQHYGYSKNVILYRESANLWLLSDILVLPPPFPWPVAFSLGDLCIALGILVLLQGSESLTTRAPKADPMQRVQTEAQPSKGWQ